ncbi:nuclear transport factor 2 family protein [Streptomyces cyaneofuscatus]|uniref:nuclear transport factor 2 family protein n=1 Tax=Streptomyces cyaneofuscatus TaxID=66883 RepID=UPI0033B5B2B4
MGKFSYHPSVSWNAGEEHHPARLASWRAMNALAIKNKDDYVSLYAPSGGIEDPVGPSLYDPAGEGHYGRDRLSEFWDKAIEPIGSFTFVISDSFVSGCEAANVGKVTLSLGDGQIMDAEGVFHYKVNAEGLLVSIRTFWELERAMKTMRER